MRYIHPGWSIGAIVLIVLAVLSFSIGLTAFGWFDIAVAVVCLAVGFFTRHDRMRW